MPARRWYKWAEMRQTARSDVRLDSHSEGAGFLEDKMGRDSNNRGAPTGVWCLVDRREEAEMRSNENRDCRAAKASPPVPDQTDLACEALQYF